jgi:hypothetical protein
MELGGNQRARHAFGNQTWDSLHAKYSSPVAKKHREALENDVNIALG